MADLNLKDFPLRSHDKIRYRDTDKQGHVNSAVFSSFLEAGRVELVYNESLKIGSENSSFVIASLKLDYLGEIKWPGTVELGTGVIKVGNSSITIFQMLFQNSACVARAESVLVQVDDISKKSKPLSEVAKLKLKKLMISPVDL